MPSSSSAPASGPIAPAEPDPHRAERAPQPVAVGAENSGRPLRILLVAPQPFFELRGTPLNVLQMVRTLCAAGHEVHLATFSMGSPVRIPGLVHHRCLPVPGIARVPIGFSWRKLVMDGSLALLVWWLIARYRFDVVHAVEEAIFYALPAARLRGVPAIYDLDSSISHQLEYAGVVRSQAVLGRIRALEAAALGRSRLALTVCQSLTEMVRELSPRTPVAQVEDCPLEESLRDPSPEAVATLRRRYALEGHPVAVYTGNLESYQGVDLLFGALPVALEIAPRARLLMVGGEADQIEAARATLAELGLADAVVFAGKQPPETMADFMAAGDALVSPRRKGQNTPLKLYSYMYAGIPIVATDLPTHTQVLDRTTAVLAAPTEAALGEALGTVLAEPARYAHLGAAARERVVRDFSHAEFTRKLLAAYSTALGRRSSSARSM